MELAKITEYENQFPKGSIIDGVVDGEKYFDYNPRIAWFPKEAYSTETDGWHIKREYAQPDAYNKFFRNTATPTWHPLIYASFGILNNFKTWNEMPFIRHKSDMCDVIKRIAIINANKLPSKTGTYTTWTNLNRGFNDCKHLIIKRVEVLQPEIHIFCNTFYLYKEMFGLTNEHLVTVEHDFENCYVYIKNGKLYLDVYHPANRSQTREKYVNQIVRAAKFWSVVTTEAISI